MSRLANAAGAGRAALLLVATMLLAACAGPAPRPTELPQPVRSAPPAAPAAVPAPAAETATPDLWQRLRARNRFARCELPRVQHWAAFYTRHPGGFARELERVLPRLRFIAQIVLDEGMPAEFALLPWVESNFRSVPPRGGRAAGAWQIMPATGRSLGLRIDHRVDQRLHLDTGTRAALRLLQHDRQKLGDWRLADMAFNAGLYAVRRAVREAPAQTVAAGDYQQLDLPQVTRDHLAKLQALACIIATPDAYAVRLPDPAAGEHLVRRELPHELPLAIAARLAGLPEERLGEINANLRDATAGTKLWLLPADHAAAFDHGTATLAALDWTNWQHVRIDQAHSLAQLGGSADADALATLAMLNPGSSQGKVRAHGTLWLPGPLLAALPAGTRSSPADLPPRQYEVRAGDSLWSIARRFNLSIDAIRSWNGLRGSLLRLGQTLILQP